MKQYVTRDNESNDKRETADDSESETEVERGRG